MVVLALVSRGRPCFAGRRETAIMPN